MGRQSTLTSNNVQGGSVPRWIWTLSHLEDSQRYLILALSRHPAHTLYNWALIWRCESILVIVQGRRARSPRRCMCDGNFDGYIAVKTHIEWMREGVLCRVFVVCAVVILRRRWQVTPASPKTEVCQSESVFVTRENAVLEATSGLMYGDRLGTTAATAKMERR